MLDTIREFLSQQRLAIVGVSHEPKDFSRALFRARRDPAALAMVPGYVGASLRRAPVLPDRDARAYVRRAQRLRELPLRAREARGKATP